jgi:medium-chain acyl-[acyl-carrier-protein] hydrolase
MKWVSDRDLAGPSRVRLFCLPHAGSGAAGFYRWKRLLSAEIAVCPVMLPGREARLGTPALRSAAEIVSALQQEVREELARPYAIFGHSMSALLAFEWARAIERAGLPGPQCLFVSGRDAPQIPFGHRNLHLMEDEAMVRALAQRYGGDVKVLLEDAALREVFMPIVRADLTVVETYQFVPGPALECKLRAFAGRSDASVSELGLEAWGEMTTGPFAARRIAGDHFFHLAEGQGELLRAIELEMEAGVNGQSRP